MRATNTILSLLLSGMVNVHAQEVSPVPLLDNFLLVNPPLIEPLANASQLVEPVTVNTDPAGQSLEQLTQEYGRDDYRLLEPLSQYAKELMSSGQFDAAHTALDNAAQIARLHEGLYAQSQFPFLLAKVENYANRGDWLHARELMEHLRWLLARNENEIDENLIHSLLDLTDLHLRGVAEDFPVHQGYHFRAALQPNLIAVIAGQQAWGRFDMRLPPMLYKLVVQHYSHVRTIKAGGRTSAALRSYSGSGATRSRADSRQISYVLGLDYLEEIRTIFQNQEQPQPVAVALSEMYIADWQVLFADSESARLGYARSFSGLQGSGIAQEEINAFFAHPVLLPVTQLIVDWDSAAKSVRTDYAASLSFQEWSPNIPFLQTPLDEYYDYPEYEKSDQSAILSFSLAGLERFTLWNLGRFQAAVSAARNLKFLSHDFSSAIDQKELQEQIEAIRFRPKLINGVPQTVNATLRYQIASDI